MKIVQTLFTKWMAFINIWLKEDSFTYALHVKQGVELFCKELIKKTIFVLHSPSPRYVLALAQWCGFDWMALCGSKFCKHRSAEIEHLSGRFAVECRGNRTLLTCQCNSSGDDLVVNLIYVARASQIPCPTKICFDEFSSGRDDKKKFI